MTQLQKAQDGLIRGVILFIVAIAVGTALWEIAYTRREEKVVESDDVTYITTHGEVALQFPADWAVNDSRYEDSFYTLEIGGPRNASIIRQVKDRDGIDLNALEVTDSQLLKVLNSSIANDYVIMAFDIVGYERFTLSKDLASRKKELLSEQGADSAFSFGNFKETKINGSKVLRYNGQLIEGKESLKSLNYYILGETAEIDVTIFPADSNYAKAAEDILKTVNISSKDNLDEALKQAEEAVNKLDEQGAL